MTNRESKEVLTRKLIKSMLKAVDDHRLTSEQRAKAERNLRNLRVIQKEKRDSRSGRE